MGVEEPKAPTKGIPQPYKLKNEVKEKYTGRHFHLSDRKGRGGGEASISKSLKSEIKLKTQ